MLENFTAQLIVPSGYLESTEAGFGGVFLSLFWRGCLFGFLIHCFFLKYSKIHPYEHLDYFVFSIGR